MGMIYKFSIPITMTGDGGEAITLGDIEGEANIYGIRGQWFLGGIYVYDLTTRRMIEVDRTDRGYGRKCWQHLLTADQKMGIAVEWAAHVTMHGEDGLLDAGEMRFRHDYEVRP